MRSGDGQEVDVRSGDQILRSLGIFSPIMVYCPTNDALVQVTDRLSPVGLCCMLDSLTGLYLTADELFAVRHSTFFNYQFGFDVSIPSQDVFDQYSLQRQHTIQLSNGTQFLYNSHTG